MTSTEFHVGIFSRPSSRVIKAPGGGSANIFGPNGEGKPTNGSGSCSETESVDGSVFSCPSTPVHNGNGINGLNGSAFGYESDTSSTPSSASSSRRGSLQDTKNRLFGQVDQSAESPRRRVVNRMKSNIFSEPEPVPIVRTPSVKYDHVVRRNPITGEALDIAAASPVPANGVSVNGNGNGNGNLNGTNGSASMPNTPTRVRQPPGGKSSNIFG